MTEFKVMTTVTIKIYKTGEISEPALQNIERLLKDYGTISITANTERHTKLPSTASTLG